MIIDKKPMGFVKDNRKLIAYSICTLAVVLTALVGIPCHLPGTALETTQWALVGALGIFSGANVGEHFSNAKKDTDAKQE